MGNQAETLRRVKAEIEQCIDDLSRGLLTVERLKSVSRTIDAAGRSSQDVLFLHAVTASPASHIVGMRIIEDGEVSDGPEDPDDWPYQTVLEAVRDGWRIIKLPELALAMDDSRTYGLGHEFVLERY